jgi:hypothetical protein
MANNTAFPVGIYIGGPDGNDPAANAQFESTFDQFSTIMGVRPKFMDAYTDNSQGDPSTWVSNAGWAAWSWARTGSAYVGPGSGIVPVVGIPMSWGSESGSNVDAAYQDIASGKYDAAFKGIVDSWIDEGYKTIQFRIGYEFNVGSIPWAVSNSSAPTASQDFVAAFQRIANIVHAEATALGATAQVVWNPGTWVSGNTTQLYPGDQYVDVMSLDEYSPTWTTDFTNWAGGGTQQVDPATWAGSPVNREHFWQYTNASQQNPTPGLSSPGWSMQDAIAFAELHNKPLSLSETGAGNSSTSPASFGPVDDPDFPQWLSSELSSAQASGVTIQNVNIWDVGSDSFIGSTRPVEAAAWAKYFGAGSVSSSGSPVAQYYQDILQRSPDAAGLQYFTSEITSDALTPEAVDSAIATSPEAQTWVDPIVRTYTVLGRAPDQAGLSGWVHAYEAGDPMSAIGLSFISSPEGKGIYGNTIPTAATSTAIDTSVVDALYQEVLGRAADPGGQAFWVDMLQTGTMSIGTVVAGLVNSSEAVNRDAGPVTNFLVAAGNGTAPYGGNLFAHE